MAGLSRDFRVRAFSSRPNGRLIGPGQRVAMQTTPEGRIVEQTESTLWDRLGIAVVVLLALAFLFAALGPMVASVGAEDSAKRDDGVQEVAVVADDDDDDDTGTGGGGGSDSGSASIGTNSADTRTGTTAGTGMSKSVSNSAGASRDTNTGTTRGTGKSKSVSNSS